MHQDDWFPPAHSLSVPLTSDERARLDELLAEPWTRLEAAGNERSRLRAEFAGQMRAHAEKHQREYDEALMAALATVKGFR